MEHSNSSKPNSPQEPHTNAELNAGNESSNTATHHTQPAKPLKLRGRYTPKNAAPAPGQSSGNPLQGGQSAAGQSYYEEQPSYQGYSQQGPNDPFNPEQPGKLKHSGLGIASFIMSILSLLAIVIGFVVIFASIIDMNESDLALLQDPAYIESIMNGTAMPSFFISILIGGLLMMGSAVISFIGFILGCISLFMKQRRKIFGILGTIFNGLMCFGGFIFMLLSFASAFAI